MSYIRLSRFYLSVALSSMILVACGEETVTKESTPKANIETTSESQTTISPEQNDSSSIQSSQENAAVEEQKELTKNQDPFNWNHVSGWHTQGIISKSSPIQINFNRHVIEKALVGSDASKVMFITPEIEGKPVFNTQSSIMWQPEEPLEHGTEYKVTIKPLNLKDVPQDAPPLQFAFNVIPLEYQIKTLGLSSVSKKPDEMLLKGEMLVSDSISDEDAQSILSAKLQNKPLVVEWLHDNNGKQHNFIIRNIKRDTFETTLQLNWTGKQLNIESEGQKEISIPSTSDFKITNISVIHEKESDPFVEILFSDEIDKTQNLNGLVKLSKNEYNVSVKNNGIYIYPKRNITGDFSVRIFKGIKAKNDLCTFDVCKKTLKEDFEQVVSFNDAKPQVKFVGKGTILPSNSILEIPFDAVGVSAVDVTAFKVHSDNVGQFLQVNGLSGDTEINRGGRYLWKKTIPISPAEPNQWNRFSFDATELMKNHSGSLIRLTVSINRRHSTFTCPGSTPTASLKEPKLVNWEDNKETDSSGWDGISDYYQDDQESNFDWDQRNNPCSDSYYIQGKNNTISSQNFISSNIGLITKQDAKGNLQVISTDIRTAKPLPGTEFEIRNFQGQVLSTGTSDGSGFANIKLQDTPFLLVAKKFDDTTYLKLNTKTALAVSHFDVGGETISKGIKGHIYGERGVWRPGDNIFLTFVLQNTSKDSEERLPEKHPVTMTLIDPQGRTVKTKTSTDSVGGFYAFNFKTDEESQTGNWLIKASVGGSSFSKPIMIETVRPNRLKLELTFNGPNQAEADKDIDVLYSADGEVNGKIFSQWLHGATAENLKTDVSVRFNTKKTKFTKFTEHEFDDPTRSLRSKSQSLLSGRLDNEGYLNFQKELKMDGRPAGMLRANFTTRVFEESGAFSISRSSVDYHHYENYVGMKLPKGDATRGMLLTDVMHTVDLASLSAKGEYSSLDKVQVSLYKIHWKWWWDKSADSLAQYADSQHKQLLQQDVVSTTEGTGKWEFQIKYPDWGRYLIRACDLEGNHCTGKVVYIDWPGWAGRAQEEGSGAASRLNLFSDKPAYSVGETATIQLPEAVQGRALLSVETGSEIIQQRWVDFEKAEDEEGRESRVQFKLVITENMAPNVYIHMTLLQPHESKSNDRPIRLYGIIPIEVSNPKSYLKPLLQASDEWEPESKQTIKVSESNGSEMNYTLAVVDEGLLGLTAFKTPNLHRNFYRKEALGIKTWDMFDEVVGAYGGKLERMLAIGGGDENENQDDDNKKRRFPPVVKYFGPFNLQPGATAEHEIDLPPYLGAVRVMLVAGNVANNTAAYGKTDKSIFVRKPLMLQSSLPRVLGPDEEVSIPVTLFVTDENIKDVKVSVITDDLSSPMDDAEQTVTIDKVGEKTVFVNVKTGSKAGKASIKLMAVAGANGEHKSEKEVFLDVRLANQETTRTTSKVIEPNTSWTNKLDAFGITGTNQAVIELSSVPSLNLKKRLDYLTRYPHGCLEQTTSAVFPQLFLSNVMELTDMQKKETEHHVRRAIDKLQRFQQNSGDFSYWPGSNSNTNPWASIYAGHFLIEAKKLGYAIPSNMLKQWLNYQSRISQEYLDGTSQYSHIQAYRLYALAVGGKPQLGAMNRLRESANVGGNKSLNKKGRWLLASAYQAASQPAAAQELIQGMDIDVSDVTRTDRTFSSTLGDLGLRLESLVALDKKQDANAILEKIAEKMAGDQYQNTQGIAWALLGVSRYLGGDTSNFSAILNQDGTATEIDSKKSFNSTRLIKADADISIENTSNVKLFANLVNSGIPKAGNEINQNNGIEMDVSYEVWDRGGPVDTTYLDGNEMIWEVPQGKDIGIDVVIRNTSDRDIENIALVIPAAAGLEMSSTQPGKEEYTYRDVRDDRVNYYFNLKKNQSKNFQLTANASYKGRYYQPAITAEAMYEGEIKATKKGLWLDIGKKRAKKMTKAEALIFSEINEKAFLYDQPDQVTTMYLIKGDRVIVNDTKIDDNQQKWYFINYKGEKELNMWIKAEAIDKTKE